MAKYMPPMQHILGGWHAAKITKQNAKKKLLNRLWHTIINKCDWVCENRWTHVELSTLPHISRWKCGTINDMQMFFCKICDIRWDHMRTHITSICTKHFKIQEIQKWCVQNLVLFSLSWVTSRQRRGNCSPNQNFNHVENFLLVGEFSFKNSTRS